MPGFPLVFLGCHILIYPKLDRIDLCLQVCKGFLFQVFRDFYLVDFWAPETEKKPFLPDQLPIGVVVQRLARNTRRIYTETSYEEPIKTWVFGLGLGLILDCNLK